MKKLMILILTICFLLLIGCGENKNQLQNESEGQTVQEENKIDGFEKPEYDKFNSYASENGLGKTLVYIEGKVLSQTKLEDNEIVAIIIEQEDKNRWVVAMPPKAKIEQLKEQTLRIFGSYGGYSDVFNLPAINLASEKIEENEKIRIEKKMDNGEYKTIWKFVDYEKEHLNEINKNKEKINSNIYETEELIYEEIGNIKFKIPKKFKDNTKKDSEWVYYYYDDLTVGVNCQKELEITNEDFLKDIDLIAKIATGDSGKTLSKEIIETPIGRAAKTLTENSINDNIYKTYQATFIHEKYMYLVIFSELKNSKWSYSECFEKLIQSIEFINNTSETNSKSYFPTKGEENALRSAKDYLKIMPFSYEGLIKQLEYEKYSHEEAVYAVDNCGADWNEQAAKSAEEYLGIMSFSKERLIQQLEYKGFTHEQAVYGVEQNGY